MCKVSLLISSRCDDIFADVKGGNYMPPPAAGGWRGGPAAAGLMAGGSMRPLSFFLRCTPNYESDRAEILYSLWGILCATFGDKKKIDRVMSGHGAMTSQAVQGQAIFARNGGTPNMAH